MPDALDRAQSQLLGRRFEELGLHVLGRAVGEALREHAARNDHVRVVDEPEADEGLWRQSLAALGGNHEVLEHLPGLMLEIFRVAILGDRHGFGRVRGDLVELELVALEDVGLVLVRRQEDVHLLQVSLLEGLGGGFRQSANLVDELIAGLGSQEGHLDSVDLLNGEALVVEVAPQVEDDGHTDRHELLAEGHTLALLRDDGREHFGPGVGFGFLSDRHRHDCC